MEYVHDGVQSLWRRQWLLAWFRVPDRNGDHCLVPRGHRRRHIETRARRFRADCDRPVADLVPFDRDSGVERVAQSGTLDRHGYFCRTASLEFALAVLGGAYPWRRHRRRLLALAAGRDAESQEPTAALGRARVQIKRAAAKAALSVFCL